MERVLSIFVWVVLAWHWASCAEVTQPSCSEGNSRVPVDLMAQLIFNEDAKQRDINCSALILTPQWLISPASCLFDYNNPTHYQVKQLNRPSEKTNSVVSKIIRHPNFNNELGAGYDLALIFVENKMDYNVSCHINVPYYNSTFSDQCELLKLSVNKLNPTKRIAKQMSIDINPKASTMCDKYKSQVPDQNLIECAKPISNQGSGVCREESGAVIMCLSQDDPEGYYLLRGLSSWGDLFCERSDGYLFTQIWAYKEWIHSYIDG